MAFLGGRQVTDPLLASIDAEIYQCDYGMNKEAVRAQVKNFLQQYPTFVMKSKTFTYGGTTSKSKMIHLHGSIILDNPTTKKQESIQIYYVLVCGFPSVAPKAFLEKSLDPGQKNPFVINSNEILNQYINNWQGFDPTYNLNLMFYYIYQSFLLHPPIGSGIKLSEEVKQEVKLSPPIPKQQQQNNNQNDERSYEETLLISKIED
jgi:hypothetical protein